MVVIVTSLTTFNIQFNCIFAFSLNCKSFDLLVFSFKNLTTGPIWDLFPTNNNYLSPQSNIFLNYLLYQMQESPLCWVFITSSVCHPQEPECCVSAHPMHSSRQVVTAQHYGKEYHAISSHQQPLLNKVHSGEKVRLLYRPIHVTIEWRTTFSTEYLFLAASHSKSRHQGLSLCDATSSALWHAPHTALRWLSLPMRWGGTVGIKFQYCT